MDALTRRQLFGRVGMSGSRVVASGVRRTALVLALALPAATWMIIAAPTPDASAASPCNPFSNCWAEYFNKNTNTNHGIFGALYAHCLHMPQGNSAFVTNEIWDANISNGYFEEVGLYSGLGRNIAYGNRNWFWGDYRPGDSQVNEHDSSVTASLDTSYRVKVEYQGNNTWYIYGNGNYSHFGTSVDQTASLQEGQAGTEYTAESGSGIRDQGSVSDLKRKSSSDTWYSWGNNVAKYANGYIDPSYNSSINTVSWSGPC
jgi:hypothetical protein